MNVQAYIQELEKQFPNWMFREKGIVYGFKNLTSKIWEGEASPENSMKVAVRVSVEGIFLFSKKENPNIAYLNPNTYLSLEEMKGLNCKGFYPIQVGWCRIDGSIAYSDGVFEPGLHPHDFMELKSVTETLIQPFLRG
ncbi:hypothetical protein ACFYKX_10750 [Cytobacillus sp. FJAT-54145]|uniref:Uncharacterized protein n=1 Tax=Cytobacillus spartinae TaxID=3299023 RepID=A0ABW6KDU8_9BACI